MEQNSEKVADKPLDYRKERKFKVNNVSLGWVEQVIRTHPAMFSQAFPPRFVNNIYFDTPKQQNLQDNIVGSTFRQKFRIRWYGDQFGKIHKPVLEIKIKKGLAGSKRHFPIAPFSLEPGFSKASIKKIVAQSGLDNKIIELLEHLTPTLLNRYHRQYFLSADQKYRVTIDHKMSFIRISAYQNYFLRKVYDHKNIIVELKYDKEYDHQASWVTDHFPFRLSKNSKYVNGIELLDLW